MLNKFYIFFIILFFVFSLCSFGDIKENLSPNTYEKKSSIMQVYSPKHIILPNTKNIKTSQIDKSSVVANNVKFDLPDLFYFIGVPIFLIILLRIVAIFIKLFEEERKREIRDLPLDKKDSA